MAEFFLELFSEEIPVSLQKTIRIKLLNDISLIFTDKNIKFKKKFSLSTPNRLMIVFQSLDKELKLKSKEIKGPSITSPSQALEGFLKSHNVNKKSIYKKKIDKGEFYFLKKKEKKVKTFDLIKETLPKILIDFKWNKSMKWGNFSLNWGRPLK